MKRIYFDMDGVLADFDQGCLDLGITPYMQNCEGTEEEKRARKLAMWDGVRTQEHFYYNLKPMPGALDMFREIESIAKEHGYTVGILTGIPSEKRQIANSDSDKRQWIKDYLGDYPMIVCLAKDKQGFVEDGDILIDDSKRNISQWKEAGGCGIVHVSVESTISQIRDLFV